MRKGARLFHAVRKGASDAPMKQAIRQKGTHAAESTTQKKWRNQLVDYAT
jgi:hypothetical protein